MEKTENRTALAWTGIGCSIITLILSACPAFVSFGAILNFFGAPDEWTKKDTAGSVMCTSILCTGILFTLLIGGFSIYYLIKAKEK
jgi:hypothetical protein